MFFVLILWPVLRRVWLVKRLVYAEIWRFRCDEIWRARYGENEQTAAEWCAFSRPRLSVGGASERRIAAKWANGCRVVLIFGIVQNLWFYQGFRARRDIDFKKTSKRLQSGAHFEYCVVFTPRSRRFQSRCGEDVPTCPKINPLKKTLVFDTFRSASQHKRQKQWNGLRVVHFSLRSGFRTMVWRLLL